MSLHKTIQKKFSAIQVLSNRKNQILQLTVSLPLSRSLQLWFSQHISRKKGSILCRQLANKQLWTTKKASYLHSRQFLQEFVENNVHFFQLLQWEKELSSRAPSWICWEPPARGEQHTIPWGTCGSPLCCFSVPWALRCPAGIDRECRGSSGLGRHLGLTDKVGPDLMLVAIWVPDKINSESQKLLYCPNMKARTKHHKEEAPDHGERYDQHNYLFFKCKWKSKHMVKTLILTKLRMRKINTKRAVPLDAVPERRTKRFPPRFRPVGRFCEPSFRYQSSPTGREGEISRPLDHVWQIPFIRPTRLQLVATSVYI